MRTKEEILDRIGKIENDFFGWEISDLLVHLPFEDARPYLRDDIAEDDWKQEQRTPKEIMIDYMSFAWEKANGERGISASRSIEHYKTWLWLDGNEELSQRIDIEYEYYGKPQLVEICMYLGLDPSEWDDGIRTN